jgi:hypothetical protein
VKYLEDGNPLLKMYETLLASAMDRTRVNQAHPAFPDLIRQLSPDEAVMLYCMSREPVQIVEHVTYLGGSIGSLDRKVAEDTWPRDKMIFPENISIYASRLEALLLLKKDSVAQDHDPWRDEKGTIYQMRIVTRTIRLSKFGRMFAAACIPKDWEVAAKPSPPA